jgi:competence protein ComEC
MKVLQFPLARITILFIFGILFTFFLKPSLSVVFAILTISSLLFIGTYYTFKTNTKSIFLFGTATYLLAFSIGSTTQTVHTESIQQNNYTHYKNSYDEKHIYTLTLREKLKNTAFSERYIAQLNTIDEKKFSGKILLNIRKDSIKRSFIIGNQLKINGFLSKNTISKNPNQFDYSKYLENKQIYAQLYTDRNNIQISSQINKRTPCCHRLNNGTTTRY